VKQIATQVQNHQKQIVSVSEYHINAGAKLLQIPARTLKSSLESLGCPMYADLEDLSDAPLPLPHSESELWSVVLQYGHHYAPFLNKTHPHWSEWLDGSGSHHRSKEDEIKIGRNLASVTLVVQKFTERLEKVDQSVSCSNKGTCPCLFLGLRPESSCLSLEVFRNTVDPLKLLTLRFVLFVSSELLCFKSNFRKNSDSVH